MNISDAIYSFYLSDEVCVCVCIHVLYRCEDGGAESADVGDGAAPGGDGGGTRGHQCTLPWGGAQVSCSPIRTHAPLSYYCT